MQLDFLIDQIADTAKDLIAALQAGSSIPNLALRRAARLPLVAALQARLGHPILLLTDRTDRALTLSDELALIAPAIPRMLFPEPTPLFYEDSAWGESTRRDRLAVLTSFATYHIPGAKGDTTGGQNEIVIAPARAVMTRTLPRREFIKATRNLKPGLLLQPNDLARNLVYLGYEPVNTVIAPGYFARRGGIFDLWPPAEPQPVRIEFFGDEIDTLRRFDPATQRTLHPLDHLLVTPAREYLAPHQVEGTEVEPGTGGPGEAQPEPLSEFLIPVLHPTPATVFDYLPRNALVILEDVESLQVVAQEIEEQSVGLRSDYIAEGNLPADFPVPYITWSEIQDYLSVHQTVTLGPVAVLESDLTDQGTDSLPVPGGPSLAERFAACPRFGGRLKPLFDHISQALAQAETRQEVPAKARQATQIASVYVVSRQAARLQELWAEQAPEPGLPAPAFMEGSLAEGFSFTPLKDPPIYLLTDGEIFGWRRPEPRQRQRALATAPEAAYADLQVGDWIVHIDHGIGRFLGLVNRTVEGIEREYLAVEYAEGDQLFVPVHQADRLTRYVGPDSRLPDPSRLSSSEWRGAKARVKEAVEEVAQDLLELYARRQVITGHAFDKDTPWQQELEASFPYVETEDQRRVIAEVKQDMESLRPMDRLICGDVGYGKTEVALRAAFKAVMEGKQVAVLVPTTVLAQQHYHTFRERLAAFPMEVEMLSRFRNPQQQREILFRLAMGGIDIVIGTHRLLQGDVQFNDLGLLIIDEEQRFGVTHKEFLKKMRTEVDVLTLTATPIPRTLYMALTGVRDISTINTPPEERLPIITHVGPYSQRLVRQAILRELERGGQVFFVHNRVQTIGAMRAHLERLVPEARLTVAHGQMPEEELSQRMEQFTDGQVDVLLSTSIIESGLDIPNANTLIVDRADTFGLAQLYQLRGRVGRGAQRAYAYFFKHRHRNPTDEGRQRLETIAENTQLGAGFSIAMRDLEIRGTGDILGTRQHGHIAAVGFHLYTRLLSDAVRRLSASTRGFERPSPGTAALQPPALNTSLALPVNVDLPLDIAIPPDYVADKNMRLRLYRRIADLRSLAELDALVEEFSDRFGPAPEVVGNLLYQLKVKLLAEKAGLSSVSVENDQIVLRFRSETVPPGLPYLGAQVRVGKSALWLPYAHQPDWQATLLDALGKLDPEGIKEPVNL
jgi:transcription-repair coupling factor (superfamily II helicase)